jgi:hypothetical protein
VIFSVNIELSENNAVLCVKRAVCDPVLVRQFCWAVDRDCIVFLVVNSCCFHFNGVVSKTDFSQAKTADVRQIVDSVQKMVVSLCSESENGAAEKVELKKCLRRNIYCIKLT